MPEPMPLIQTTIAPGLPVYVCAVSVDPTSNEIVYLDMTGPAASIKASLAVLWSQKRYLSIAQTPAKLNRKRNKVIRKTLSTRQVNVVIVHNQALPMHMLSSRGYAYAIDTKETNYYATDDNGDPTMPERFMDVLMPFLTTPMRREWAPHVWHLAIQNYLVSRLPNWTQKNMRVFKISQNENKWQILYKRLIPATVTF